MNAVDILLKDFRPTSQLVTEETRIEKPCHPVIDAHNHLGPDFGGGWSERSASELLEQLDRCHITTYIDLDGGWSERILFERLSKFKAAAPDRFVFFASPNWQDWESKGPGFAEHAARRLEVQSNAGAEGLKIWKDFGLHVKDHTGALARIDDPSLAPLWQTAAELDLPVMIHIADPVAFFDPINELNERIEELAAHPDWHFPSPPFPKFAELIEAFAQLVRQNPKTIFVGAHVGCYAENLTWVSDLLDECPNFNIDFSARLAEIGRQPYAAKRFFEKYQDRILFGIDAGPDLATYQTYWRFLETLDEHFDYAATPTPQQGRWRINGIGLEKDVLKKIYFDNARRLIVTQ